MPIEVEHGTKTVLVLVYVVVISSGWVAVDEDGTALLEETLPVGYGG